MALPVRVVASGGLPVQLSLTAFGMPIELSTLSGALPVSIVTTGGVPCLDTLGNVFASFTAPVLAFASATDPDSDNTQDFDATFFEDIETHYVRLVGTFGSATPTEPYDIDQSNLIDASEAGALLAAFTTGVIPDGVCSFKCRIQAGSGSGGAAESNWSNIVTKTIDAAPALTSPTDAETGETTGSGTVTTDQAVGTLYWVVSTSATPPSAAQVKLGQMHTGAAAADSGSQAVSITGVQTVTGGFAGLTASTAYFAHYMHEDTTSHQSNVASADGFTTDAASGVAPANTVLPAVTGGAWVYGLLATTDGTWDGSPTSFTYQWKNAGVDIGGATSNTYVLQLTDIGDNITCVVTATNAFGSTPATSNTIAVAAAGTNIMAKTELFDNAYWTKAQSTIGANDAVAPDGATTADDFRESALTNVHQIFPTSGFTISNGTPYTLSMFVKPNERTIFVLVSGNNSNVRTWFDLSGAGSILTNEAGNTAEIVAVANGWYRIRVTRTSNATSAFPAFRLATADNVDNYLGVAGNGAWVWGIQYEQTSAMTSYTVVA